MTARREPTAVSLMGRRLVPVASVVACRSEFGLLLEGALGQTRLRDAEHRAMVHLRWRSHHRPKRQLLRDPRRVAGDGRDAVQLRLRRQPPE